MIHAPKSRLTAILAVSLALLTPQFARGQVVRHSGRGYQVIYPQSGVIVTYERAGDAWRAAYPFTRYERIEDRVIVVDGRQTIVRGAGSRIDGDYSIVQTFPFSYLGWSARGMTGGWDYWGRWRAGYPYGVPFWGGYYEGTYQGGVIIGERQHLDDLRDAAPSYLESDDVAPEDTDPSAAYSSTEEYALSLARDGRYAESLEALRQFGLRPADDVRAMPDWRIRAVALAGMGRYSEAAERMLDEYMLQPWLASRPLAAGDLAPSSRMFRSILTGAVQAAHADDSASMWLLVATLMQAEGRDRPAWKMIGRAEEAGLDGAIVDQFEAALSPGSAG